MNAYGGTILEHFRRPRNQRALGSPTAVAESVNPLCGDRVRIELAIADARIADAAFTANACAICTASASLLTERLRGMTAGDAAAFADDDLLVVLGAEVPPARRACAILPLRALRLALAGTPAA